MKTIIVIPSRMASKRFPNKPLALIQGKPMIQRVWEQAKASNLGEVIVACGDREIYDLINSIGGEAVMTDANIPTGTDRIFEVFKNHPNKEQIDHIINLQGDMPIIDSKDISKVKFSLMQGFDMGTLATNLTLEEEKNENITKVKIQWIKKNYFGQAVEFYKNSKKTIDNIYHHVGIYSFSHKVLKKFVELKPTKNEINNKLEQLRALENGIDIGVSFVDSIPISVDTEEDLIKVESIIKNKK